MARQAWIWTGFVAVALVGACASENAVGLSPWEEVKRYVRDAGPPPRWPRPLTNDRLREIARARGFGSPSAPLFNGNVGRAFQRWALAAFPGRPLLENTRNVPSGYRRAATRLRQGGPVLAVRPDAMGGAVTVVWEQLLDVPLPRTEFLPDCVLIEIKAVRGPLTMFHSSHQIGGLIDAAASATMARVGGVERPTPAVVFITTLDTSVAPDVLEEANQRGVAIWQGLAFELLESTTAEPKLGIGQVVPLNWEIYSPSFPQPLAPGPTDVPFPLRGVQPPPVPFDPDPPEVQ